MNYNVKWQVSLNNGETFYENKGFFLEIENELSPWNKLQNYILQNNFYITSLSLYTDTGQRWNLPSLSQNPKFKAFDLAIKPFKFSLERKIGLDWDDKNKQDIYTCIIAWFNIGEEQYKLSTWVDEKNTNNCWSLIVKE